MINLNIPSLSKESVMYIVGGGLALAVICGAYLGGVSLGAQEAAEQLQKVSSPKLRLIWQGA
jgi:hypothetical protein